MSEPSYLCKVPVVIKSDDSGIRRSSHLHIPSKYEYLTGIASWIPTGRFLDTIVDVDPVGGLKIAVNLG